MHWNVFCHSLDALSPTYPLIALLSVLGEAKLVLVSSPAFWVGLVNGKHQQKIRGKKEELVYLFIPFPPCYSIRFWRWLCFVLPSDRHLQPHRSVYIHSLRLPWVA